MAQASQSLKYRIEGMDCPSCATKIENAVGRLAGIGSVSVSVGAGSMRVEPNGAIAPGAIESRVEALGFTIARMDAGDPDPAPAASDHHHAHGGDAEGPWWRSAKARLTIACAAALAAAYGIGVIFPDIGHWAFLAAMLVGLTPIARRALAAARTGTPFSIETLMTIAAIGAIFIGATEEAAELPCASKGPEQGP